MLASPSTIRPPNVTDGEPSWIRLFDDRYGPDAFARLLSQFEKPCVTYAQIAGEYGVTRERVRQWHLRLAPDSPRGHERRRQCHLYRQKRKLLDDPLFRAFVRAARAQTPAASVALIPAHEGYRKRLVRLGDHTVVLKRAPRIRQSGAEGEPTYGLTSSRVEAAFIFYLLERGAYLFVPKSLVPRGGTTFLDVPASKYQHFRDRFASLAAGAAPDGGARSSEPHDAAGALSGQARGNGHAHRPATST